MTTTRAWRFRVADGIRQSGRVETLNQGGVLVTRRSMNIFESDNWYLNNELGGRCDPFKEGDVRERRLIFLLLHCCLVDFHTQRKACSPA